jgi:ribosomal protein S12 methylthiotransferase accessory factor
MLEALQSRLTIITGSRDDLFSWDYEAMLNEKSMKSNELLALARSGSIDFGDGDSSGITPNLNDELLTVLGILADRSIERVIAVDLSMEELGITVCRIVIPGLEMLANTRHYQPGLRARAVLEADG